VSAREASPPKAHPISEAVTRAEVFVLREAGPLERTFWQTLLRRQDGFPLLAALGTMQGEDGALRPWRDPTPLAATLRGLTWLDAIGLLDHPVPERAVGYLLQQQGPDGGWTQPGASEAECIALSGEVTGLLAKTPYARASALRRAEAFLAGHWAVERVQGPSYAPILAYVHALVHIHSEIADEVLQWCGRELERGYRTRVFSPVAVARVFVRARARALPGLRVEPAELVASLLAAQAEDGGWDAEPETPRLDATLEAVEALLRLGSGGA
jgi:hypothetical protein